MNPSIEVQITAKLDQLDAGLKVAEAKISKSAVTMGKVGEKAGTDFVANFAQNLPMMMVATAMAKTIGGGLLQAVKDVNAGKSGEEIGIGIAQGIVDGAKSLPVVGVVFGILDEMVNGATRYIEKLNEAVAKAVEKYISSMQAMTQATKDFQKTAREKAEDVTVGGSPELTARLAATRQNQKAAADAQAAKELGQQALRDLKKKQSEDDAASMAKMEDEGISGDQIRRNEGRISRDEEIVQRNKDNESAMKRAAEAVAKNDRDIDAALVVYKLANQEELNKKIKEMNNKAAADSAASAKALQEKSLKTAMDTSDYQGAQKQIDAKAAEDVKALNKKSLKTAMNTDDYAAAIKEINAKAAAEQKALDEKSQKDAKEMGNQMVADWKEQQKEKYDAAIQAQQDIIDAEKQAQAQIDKIGRVDQMAGEAARGMINSGQTALGQFNFAQAGAGGTALDMAKKQVMSLEKIEAATAEQVRLTKENKGFQ